MKTFCEKTERQSLWVLQDLYRTLTKTTKKIGSEGKLVKSFPMQASLSFEKRTSLHLQHLGGGRNTPQSQYLPPLSSNSPKGLLAAREEEAEANNFLQFLIGPSSRLL